MGGHDGCAMQPPVLALRKAVPGQQFIHAGETPVSCCSNVEETHRSHIWAKSPARSAKQRLRGRAAHNPNTVACGDSACLGGHLIGHARKKCSPDPYGCIRKLKMEQRQRGGNGPPAISIRRLSSLADKVAGLLAGSLWFIHESRSSKQVGLSEVYPQISLPL